MNELQFIDPDTGQPILATAFVAQASNAGNTASQIASTLVQLGLAVGDIGQVFDAVRTGGMVPAQQAQALAVQSAYLQQQAAARQSQMTLLLLAAGLGLIYFASKKN